MIQILAYCSGLHAFTQASLTVCLATVPCNGGRVKGVGRHGCVSLFNAGNVADLFGGGTVVPSFSGEGVVYFVGEAIGFFLLFGNNAVKLTKLARGGPVIVLRSNVVPIARRTCARGRVVKEATTAFRTVVTLAVVSP